MINEFDPPKDGADDEESGLPALYTYLGQFVDHDAGPSRPRKVMDSRDGLGSEGVGSENNR